MKLTATEVTKVITSHADPMQATILQRFFKTGDGQYAAGDKFVGIMVPQSRRIAREFRALPLDECEKLLHSPIHEARIIALFILVDQFKRGDDATRRAIYNLYLANTAHINNWDLVDTSAPHIIGGYLMDRSRAPLLKLARSQSLWERRIAIIATLAFIQKQDFEDTLRISEMLLSDTHDLIHKAVGWMLREVGKRDVDTLKLFLQQHIARMPRTTLRYAIEKFDARTRKAYLARPRG